MIVTRVQTVSRNNQISICILRKERYSVNDHNGRTVGRVQGEVSKCDNISVLEQYSDQSLIFSNCSSSDSLCLPTHHWFLAVGLCGQYTDTIDPSIEVHMISTI